MITTHVKGYIYVIFCLYVPKYSAEYLMLYTRS